MAEVAREQGATRDVGETPEPARMPTTPEEREVLRRILQSVALGGDMGATVITELRVAIEAEREACAKIADDAADARTMTDALLVARAIRSRGSK